MPPASPLVSNTSSAYVSPAVNDSAFVVSLYPADTSPYVTRVSNGTAASSSDGSCGVSRCTASATAGGTETPNK